MRRTGRGSDDSRRQAVLSCRDGENSLRHTNFTARTAYYDTGKSHTILFFTSVLQRSERSLRLPWLSAPCSCERDETFLVESSSEIRC